MIDEYEDEEKESKLKKVVRLVGGGMSREEKSYRYFGRPPAGVYPKHSDLAHIHDMRFSREQIRRLYNLPLQQEDVAMAVESDTKEGLIKELVEQTSMTRREAENVIKEMLANGTLRRVRDENLGEVLVFRGR